MTRTRGLILTCAAVACMGIAGAAYWWPVAPSAAMRACVANHAYTRALFGQCLQDYAAMTAARKEH